MAFAGTAKLGDPALADTQIGPIATRAQFEKILGYIDIAKKEGAKLALGGAARTDLGAGQFIEPTIFTGVRNDMRIAQEEVFGPVLSVIAFEDEEDAIRIGNDVVFGLAAGVWTRSLRRALLLTDKAAGRDGLGEQLPRHQLHRPFRRLQEFRHRPRVRARSGQGIPAHQVRLALDRARCPQPLHPPLGRAPCLLPCSTRFS